MDGSIEILGGFPFCATIPANFYSFPYTGYDWCLMVPIEPKIPIYKVFAYIFHWKAFALTVLIFVLLSVSLGIADRISNSQQTLIRRNFFFNIDCFRGILGQSIFEVPNASWSTKIIYLLIFLLGIMIVTSYDAFLQSFMTEPPTENMIRSFDDLKASGIKAYIYKTDFNTMLSVRPDMNQYLNSFEVETNFEKYKENPNTKYAYSTNTVLWGIFKNQQTFFDQQLFRWSADLCIWNNIQAAFALNDNSIYRNVLNMHILEVQSAGFIDFWMTKAFYELMELGRIQKMNINNLSDFRSLSVEDLKWIWIMIGFAYWVAILTFVGEIFVLKMKNYGQN
ncbi:uncharacterized protein LOC129918079 [Episyrphus balteatus]|uniref:uncharacterized protein LOC129918079 n=1 Tax=Episyrphus balteatus TaxID=286459 RepID=UPI0024850B37|nr:uncharacterized protein LOC129918079 [Episyrphus balteatus]